LFSPPAVSAALGFLVVWQEHPFWEGALRAIIYGTLTSLVPLAMVIYLVKIGRVGDIHMSLSPQQRRIPYLVGFLGALLAFILFYLWGDSPLLTALAACNVLGLGALGLINNFWLISNHTASAMLVAVFSAYVFGWQTGLWLLLLVGLVVWSRWQLRKHTFSQLVAGLLVGAAPVILLANLGFLVS
jgi:membrane-associated phospholipid phosphatase